MGHHLPGFEQVLSGQMAPCISHPNSAVPGSPVRFPLRQQNQWPFAVTTKGSTKEKTEKSSVPGFPRLYSYGQDFLVDIIMYNYGLYSHGLNSYSLYSYGLDSHGLI